MKRFFHALVIVSMLGLTARTQVKPQEKDIKPELLSLANAERAFAKMSVDKGVREAFYNNFAEDGINFQPHPVITREAYRKNPPPAPKPDAPPPPVLNWAPIYGDIASSGDLGYTTGPFLIEDRSPAKRPARHGMYSSVWKKQADGSWKVVLDLGIQMNAAVAPLDAPFQAAPQRKAKVKPRNVVSGNQAGTLLRADLEFFWSAKGAAASQAWQKYLSDDARIHRNFMMPVTGKSDLRMWISKQTMAISGGPIKTDVAQSGDFGYSYGQYELKGEKIEKGYYARVWKRDATGDWRIVFDVTGPLPEETK
jgi:ketosteroid isomerase-like protein